MLHHSSVFIELSPSLQVLHAGELLRPIAWQIAAVPNSSAIPAELQLPSLQLLSDCGTQAAQRDRRHCSGCHPHPSLCLFDRHLPHLPRPANVIYK